MGCVVRPGERSGEESRVPFTPGIKVFSGGGLRPATAPPALHLDPFVPGPGHVPDSGQREAVGPWADRLKACRFQVEGEECRERTKLLPLHRKPISEGRGGRNFFEENPP